MKQHRLMSRVSALALGLAVAVATLSLASAQQEPPHRFYGHGATAGDTIGVVDDMGDEIASTTVDENGSWYIDVDRDAVEGVTFTLNGKSADAEVTSTGADLTAVVRHRHGHGRLHGRRRLDGGRRQHGGPRR